MKPAKLYKYLTDLQNNQAMRKNYGDICELAEKIIKDGLNNEGVSGVPDFDEFDNIIIPLRELKQLMSQHKLEQEKEKLEYYIRLSGYLV
ncbi:MAG: hypothetical protein OXF85_00375 [Candidatus Saccharibacteria bacterium]|nr:hypothetical protein [Candidatus Saccharibacteria bacterium]